MTEPKHNPGKLTQPEIDKIVRSSASRFWECVDTSGGPAACWPWLRGKCAGYGWFYIGGGRRHKIEDYAHRVALFLTTGKWGKVGRHSCDNYPCCNPTHLSWGSHSDNSQDALERGRAYVGEANSNARTTAVAVREARRLREQGKTYSQIANATGISSSNLNHILNGRTWQRA